MEVHAVLMPASLLLLSVLFLFHLMDYDAEIKQLRMRVLLLEHRDFVWSVAQENVSTAITTP